MNKVRPLRRYARGLQATEAPPTGASGMPRPALAPHAPPHARCTGTAPLRPPRRRCPPRSKARIRAGATARGACAC